MEKSETQGYLYILIGSTLWGISSVVAKALFNTGLPPIELILVRLTLATIILALLLIFFDQKRMKISTRDLPYFFILGIIGVGGMNFFYYTAISTIHTGPAILLQYIQPIWVSLYAFLFQGEPISKGKMAALFLAVLGCFFAVGGYDMDLLALNKIGILSGITASFFFTFYALYGEKGLKKYDAWTLILYGFGFASLLYWVLCPPVQIIAGGHSFRTWLAFIYIAIFSTLIPFGFYFKGIEHIRATRASITSTWEPVMAGGAAYLVLGEELTPLQVLGGMGVLAAVALLQLAREKGSPSNPLELRKNS